MTLAYADFLREKVNFERTYGFDVADDEINQILLPHQRDAVRWAVRGGRRALFEAPGLGKTVQQLEVLRLILNRTGGRALVVIPLGVRQEFTRDAAMLDQAVTFVRRDAEVAGPGVYLTNYESVRDGKLDPGQFDAVSLDEASVLRSFGSKTYQTFLTLFEAVKYRFVATATPSPNRYKELIHYAGFLGIMDTGAALTRWFQRDSTKANNLTLYPHKQQEFWLWVSTWALFLQVLEVDVQERHIRLDGGLYANARPATPAVRVAFDSMHGPLTYATDRFTDWQDNVRAIALGLEALRKVDRYGITKRGEQYAGWKALPAGAGETASHMTNDDARQVLRAAAGIHFTNGELDDPDERRAAHRRARAAAHPDRHNGDRTLWDEVEQAAKVLGVLS